MSDTAIPEIEVEREYDNQLAHARAMYHMALQAAEAELDEALAAAEDRRTAALAEARHGKHRAVQGPKMVRPYHQDPAEYQLELLGIGITRMTDLS